MSCYMKRYLTMASSASYFERFPFNKYQISSRGEREGKGRRGKQREEGEGEGSRWERKWKDGTVEQRKEKEEKGRRGKIREREGNEM